MKLKNPAHARKRKRTGQANYQHRHRDKGLCRLCPERCDINPHTQKSYHLCPAHREAVAAKQKLRMRQRRAAGLA